MFNRKVRAIDGGFPSCCCRAKQVSVNVSCLVSVSLIGLLVFYVHEGRSFQSGTCFLSHSSCFDLKQMAAPLLNTG